MVQRPTHFGIFEFARLASLRAAQLTRGCTPRVEPSGKMAVTAQREVAAGKLDVVAVPLDIESLPPDDGDAAIA